MALVNSNDHVTSTTRPITLTFNNLKVNIKDKTILDGVSGFVNPGEVLAVMGPSGSGKTTLLSFLAGRKVGDVKSGEVLLNGRHINKKLKRKICYVLQEDLFFDNLTLKETLTYSALLRLPEKMPKCEKLKKVDEIIETLDISKCVDTKIGNSIDRGLSGGEKKRANIGCELITNPSLIFLDEPTSGLDSNNAFNLVKTLETFAVNKSKTIVMTIHQPSSQIFYLFEKLLLMANGKVAYYGKASEVLDFFERVGFHCEEHFNPADYILEVVSRGDEVETKIITACREWTKDVLPALCDGENNTTASMKKQESYASLESVELGVQNLGVSVEENGMNSLSHVEVGKTKHHEVHKEEKWPTSFWTQFSVLSHRTFKQSRSVILSKLVFTQNMILAVTVGLLWFQLPNKEETINDRRGVLFFLMVYWGINPLFRALLTFPSEEVIIRKERSAGTYRLSAYFFAKGASEVPLVILQPLLFLMISYWMNGLNPSIAFLSQAFNLVLSSILSQSLGLAIGATVMSFDKAIVVAAITVLTSLLLGGFYVKNFPPWLTWLKYFSFITYSFENSLLIEFTGIEPHSCGQIKTNYLSCANNGTTITGEEILSDMGIERSMGENIAILFGFIVVFRVLAYCSLRFLHKPD